MSAQGEKLRLRLEHLFQAADYIKTGILPAGASGGEETPSPIPSTSSAAVNTAALFPTPLATSTRIRVALDASGPRPTLKWTLPAAVPAAQSPNGAATVQDAETDVATALVVSPGRTAALDVPAADAAAGPTVAAVSRSKRKREVVEPEPGAEEEDLQRGTSRRSVRIRAQGPKKYGK